MGGVMSPLEVYGPPLVEYTGKGSLIFDEVTQVLVDFRCIQLHNADIYVHVNFLESVDLNIINNIYLINLIQGHLDDGRSFKSVGDAWLTELNITSDGNTRVEGLMILSQIDIDLAETDSNKMPTKSKFYLTNLRFLGSKMHWPTPSKAYRILPLEIKGLNVTIFPVEKYKKLEKEMCATKACTVTSFLEIPYNILSKEAILNFVANLCSLLSFAKGTEIIWPYYQEVDDLGTVITSIHRSSITSNFGSWEIIPFNNPTDLKTFLETSYGKYIALSNEYRLDKIFHTIVRSKLGGSFLELRALNVSSSIDVLRGRWSKSHDRVKITPATKFKKCKELLKILINDFVRLGVTNDQVDQMLNKIPELNRPSLKDVLKEMVIDIGSDISINQIELFIKTRNKLVHESCFATDNQYQEFVNIIYLADNLVMTLLDYQGPYIDCRTWERVARS
jgi:hypothetical protein